MERNFSALLFMIIFAASTTCVPFIAFGATGAAPVAEVGRSLEILRQESERPEYLKTGRVYSFHNMVIEGEILSLEQKTRLKKSLEVSKDLFLTKEEVDGLKSQVESFLAEEKVPYAKLSIEITAGILRIVLS